MDHHLQQGTSSGTEKNLYDIMHSVLVDTGASTALLHGSHGVTQVIHVEFANLAFDSDRDGGLSRIRKLGD